MTSLPFHWLGFIHAHNLSFCSTSHTVHWFWQPPIPNCFQKKKTKLFQIDSKRMIIAFKGNDSNIYNEDNNNNCKQILLDWRNSQAMWRHLAEQASTYMAGSYVHLLAVTIRLHCIKLCCISLPIKRLFQQRLGKRPLQDWDEEQE